MLQGLLRRWQRSQSHEWLQWLRRRHAPEPGTIVLGQRRIYVLPTRQGLGFVLALLVMLIGAINYNLSLGYLLVFLLGGMGLVCILHTFRNLAQLQVSAGTVPAVFAGDTALFELRLDNRSTLHRHALQARCDVRGQTGEVGSRENLRENLRENNLRENIRQPDSISFAIAARSRHTLQLPVTTRQRGWLALPQVVLQTRYPLGLLRAWSYLRPAMQVMVYPSPAAQLLPWQHADGAAEQHSPAAVAASSGSGVEDFTGLRPFRSGDAMAQVAWKQLARDDSLHSKQFSGARSAAIWLDWHALPAHLDTEARLSQLCARVLQAEAKASSAGSLSAARYGLRLPGHCINPDQGAAHRAACLQALALFEPALFESALFEPTQSAPGAAAT
jgi:uncharacterized protein (DUF58 family)